MKEFENYKLYIENINIFSDAKIYDKEYIDASIERRKKIDMYKFDKDKKLSLLAEMLLKRGLKGFNVNINDCEFLYGNNEKPYIKNKNIYYNISHSNEYVICGFSEREIGVDIENIKDIDLSIAKRFFYHSEYENILSQNSKEKMLDLFYRYWVLKESFMKCTGLGMGLPLDSFEIIIDNDVKVKQTLNNKIYKFYEKSDIIGYKVAVCIDDTKFLNK